MILESHIFIRPDNLLGKFPFFSYFVQSLGQLVIFEDYNEWLIYEDFIDSCILSQSKKGISNFTNIKIESFHLGGKFYEQTIFKSYDVKLKLDFISPSWMCFYFLQIKSNYIFFFPFQLCFLNFLNNLFSLRPNYTYGLPYLVLG